MKVVKQHDKTEEMGAERDDDDDNGRQTCTAQTNQPRIVSMIKRKHDALTNAPATAVLNGAVTGCCIH